MQAVTRTGSLRLVLGADSPSVPGGWRLHRAGAPFHEVAEHGMNARLATLCVESGPDRGRSVRLLGSETTLGRGPESTVQLADPGRLLSRIHACIRIRPDGSHEIEGLGSHGTHVGRREVTGSRCSLRDGDSIVLAGRVHLRYHTEGRRGRAGRRLLQAVAALWERLRCRLRSGVSREADALAGARPASPKGVS